ncbi:glycosyltransferase family 2 protein [Mucilaginibacter sp. HMF5004]|uniref:glycosyltransferase family 2 protein n=1 Tax=Mucilaginibacter rivuli TaxID=2857527 RepID=UPI001C5F2F16|nr:glycosyltransferase family 2 protein [Mucilaginibacter rivuli]MBW4891854.1 glycosyltransferase family 2 protein [Mucilaginibacter rivuli]
MKLSIIIVNYNRRDLISQALSSLIKAAENIEHEIFVVDNASLDLSQPMIQGRYPHVKLIENQKNVGLSKASNQALRQATGEYVLLIHPDTITNDDTLTKTLAFMDIHPKAGGLGVRMINGQGQFLPESKRGLPTPWAFFFRMTNFYKLFPKSRLINRYHADWIEEFETAEVDILSAAFMLIRRSVLAKTGLLDERFFIYGEDIDLSYRIRLAGYKNYYFPKTYIIHLRGLSLQKFTWNYISNFYGAMFIFAAKYFIKTSMPKLAGMRKLNTPQA